MTKLENDKYYTPNDLASRLIETTFDVLEKENCTISEIIEPSAGSGSFSEQLVCTAYDISPEGPDIIKADFLTADIPYKKGRLCIGNPPFGRANTLSVRFFKKCIQIADYIAFIQPISQLNNNSQMFEFDLIYSENLGAVTYSDRLIQTCFNIYRRPKNGELNTNTSYLLKDVSIVEYRRGRTNNHIPDGYDYAICSWGKVGSPSRYIGQYALESYIYVHNKEYLVQIGELLAYDKLRDYFQFTKHATMRLGKVRLCTYFKDKIEGIS